MANEIITEIKLELDKFRADLAESEKMSAASAARSGKEVGEAVEEGLGHAGDSIKEKFLEIGAIIATTFTVEKAIEAASSEEAAVNQLNLALATTGQYTDEAARHFEEYATTLSRTTLASKEAVLQGASLIQTMGKLSEPTLQRATKAALDLSAAMHVTAEQGFAIVERAAGGNVTALNKLGLKIFQTGDTTKDFTHTLDVLEGRFRGLAELQTNTFAGSVNAVHTAITELLATVGKLVTASPTMIKILKTVSSSFLEAAEAVAKWGKGRDVVQEFGQELVVLGGYVKDYLILPFEFAFNLIKVGFDAVKVLWQAQLTALVMAAEKLTGFLARFSNKAKEMHEALATFSESTKDTLGGFVTDTKAAWETAFDFPVTAAAEKFIVKSKQFLDTVRPPLKANLAQLSNEVQLPLSGFGAFFSGFAEGFTKASKSMTVTARELGAQIHSTISVGVTNSFAAMGSALASGHRGMEAFGKAMLGVLGDIAVQSGAAFIALGVARLAASYGLDPSAYGLIAAGGVLATIGGALKAIAGGGGGGSPAQAPTSQGGGVAAGNGGIQTPANNPATGAATTQPGIGTAVTVNVHGNILDRRQTGLELAEVINESFRNNGVAFASGGL